MKKKIFEQIVLLYSIIKWFILATIIGIIVGLSTTIFLKLLNLSINFTNNFYFYFLLLPVVFFLNIILTKYVVPEAEGHGTEKVIEAIHKRNGKMNPLMVPIKLFTTILTLALGGSAGKEGPCAQIGAGLSSMFADIFKFNDTDRKKLVICGISAGFASVFGTPIAGAIFGLEVLVVGTIMYDVLLPSFISGIIAFEVSSFLGIKYSYYHMALPSEFTNIFPLILLSGIFFGLCSFFLIEVLNSFKFLSKKINIWKPLKGLIGGMALIVLTFIFSTQFLGLGLNTIEDSLKGMDIVWYAFIIKIVFTAITLNFGGSGGILTPIFFIGSTSRVLFAKIFGLNIYSSFFAAIGMAALLAGAANTPISASIMAVELFGVGIAPYASIACIISFLITGHRSVYPSQMLGFKKSILIDVEVGKEINTINPEAKIQNSKLLKFIFDRINKNKPE